MGGGIDELVRAGVFYVAAGRGRIVNNETDVLSGGRNAYIEVPAKAVGAADLNRTAIVIVYLCSVPEGIHGPTRVSKVGPMIVNPNITAWDLLGRRARGENSGQQNSGQCSGSGKKHGSGLLRHGTSGSILSEWV